MYRGFLFSKKSIGFGNIYQFGKKLRIKENDNYIYNKISV